MRARSYQIAGWAETERRSSSTPSRKRRTLISGAAAAGAKVHTLPVRPRDVADDGEFHYAVLGPHAASEAGRPSAEARRFIEQATAPDRERVYRNAIVLVVPSRDSLDAARTRVREYLGWEEVRAQLQEQPIDPLREQMLATEIAAARKRQGRSTITHPGDRHQLGGDAARRPLRPVA